ncbi:MAG: hypothetical protein H0V01_09255 [Bacteroidetes bacterium]|nr:hypothetical protein [Bacteroidota bacterium]HET6243073.1 hypothetical protein [Bacteroidia bacterium]
MKKRLLIALLILINSFGYSQQNYNDFELNGVKHYDFGFTTGNLESPYTNFDTLGLNISKKCAMYVRNDSAIYDVIHQKLLTKLSDVSSYATNITTKKIKMKVYSKAPIGTAIELQLGLFSNEGYPSGIHCIYTSQTTVKNQWEELVFDFSEIPFGSLASATEIDRLTLLFNPNPQIIKGDTFYFDDLSGPELFDVGISESVSDIQNTFLEQN